MKWEILRNQPLCTYLSQLFLITPHAKCSWKAFFIFSAAGLPLREFAQEIEAKTKWNPGQHKNSLFNIFIITHTRAFVRRYDLVSIWLHWNAVCHIKEGLKVKVLRESVVAREVGKVTIPHWWRCSHRSKSNVASDYIIVVFSLKSKRIFLVRILLERLLDRDNFEIFAQSRAKRLILIPRCLQGWMNFVG